MNTKAPLGRNLIVVLAGQVMNVLQNLLILPVVIRLAGEAAYGTYVLALTIVSLLFGLLSTGVPYRYQRNLISANTYAERRALFEPQFTFQVIVVTFLAALSLVLTPRLELALSGPAYFTPLLLVALLACRLINRQTIDYFQFSQRFFASSLSVAIGPYLFVTALLLLGWRGKPLSLNDLLLTQSATTLIICLPLLIRLVSEIGMPRLHLPWATFVKDLSGGYPLMLELIVDFFLNTSDRYLLGIFLSIEAVAQYQPAYQLGSLMLFLPNLVGTVLMPTLARLVDTASKSTAEDLVANFVALFAMIAIPFTVGSLMLGPTVIEWLTTAEIAAASRLVAPVVALGVIFYGIWLFTSLTAFILGRTRTILVASISGATTNFVMNLVFLPLFRSIDVAAVTTTIGYATSCTCALFLLRGEWDLKIRWSSIARYVIAAICMGGLLFALGFYPGVQSSQSLLHVTSAVMVAILAYFGALWVLGAFGGREIRQLIGLVQRNMPEPGPS